ncbi:Nitroreductase [Halopseudomonas litoralis]|uniref:Putative NAD(P)H nitroreductase n=1 Tax=Halopseudomonas litoralis TaxID=797277 RepID=A0A1H1SW96_9GAMM|nr:nitroreductase [Halopseudomonas litoralis]SDS52252.1 Nitroreductase [Halopseudomonas litoralis]
MDALTALHNRVSMPRLIGPAPTPEQQEALFQAALRTPDHARLRPWRFLVLEGQGLERLGELFTVSALNRTGDPNAAEVLRAPSLPQRAPMIIIAISSARVHPKVPEIEQDMSCAVAVGNMLVAAHALGLGAVWRTGELAYDPLVREGLGLQAHEKIIAFLYLGQSMTPDRAAPELEPRDFFRRWPES